MPQYLLSVHGVEEGPYATPEDMERAFRDVGALNAEIRASGAWVFAGGLMPASTARVVRQSDGALLHTDGPYLEGKEHIGGFCGCSSRPSRRSWGPSACGAGAPGGWPGC